MDKTVIDSYPRYDSYKNSGVDWLGEVPEGWDLGRISSFFKERRRKVSDKDYPALSVTKTGVFPQWDHVAKSNDGDNRKLVKEGDFVINSRSDRKGSSGIAKQDGSVSLINIVLEPKNIEPRFSEYLFKSNAFIEEFYRVGHGIVADLWTTRFDNIKNSLVSLPSDKEQTKIADFLDKKTNQIDQAITLKQQQIAKLEEYKQIVIQNAVTKGLNPDAPMKDSGVDWIGDIPEHWEVKKLKYLGNSIIGLTYSPDDVTDKENGKLVLRSSNLQNGKLYYSEKANVYVSTRISDKLTLKESDILICSRNGSRSLIGKCAIAKSNDAGVTFGAFTTVFRSNMNEYLYHIFNSNVFKFLSGSFLTSTINQLTIGNLNSMEMPIPPEIERQKIRLYLTQINIKFDEAQNNCQTQIDRLKEYKTILINQAVTGKIKIS
ncbi:restriction endonuclease subunit S [Psychrobacter sp. AOP29-E1-7]|uniref:restriction endonuclease subunit S n=1 Tax=Psychrobacter sp. AOP29-E1-7 TaxID=3457702 RepID=UPI00403702D0